MFQATKCWKYSLLCVGGLLLVGFALGCQQKKQGARRKGGSTPAKYSFRNSGAPVARVSSDRVAQAVPRVRLSSPPAIPTNVDPAALRADQTDADFALKLLAWNVESEGSDPNVIAEELAMLNSENRYGIVGLTEVLPSAVNDFKLALGKNYAEVHSESGFNDRMQILFDESRFEKIRQFEIQEINFEGRYRAPLVVHLKRRADEVEFLVMINHLARGKAEVRQQQAKQLVEWARDQTLPILAMGDYNFDYVFATKKGNPAFVQFLRDDVWKWVKPEEWIDTNWYDNPQSPDGRDDYPGSMLDFNFVANAAKTWPAKSRVIVRPGDFPDDKTTSDHRPVELLIKLPVVGEQAGQGDPG